jgi:hypothetical protein
MKFAFAEAFVKVKKVKKSPSCILFDREKISGQNIFFFPF